MEIVSFMDIEETDKDLMLSFALDIGNGRIKTLLLHRTLFCESLLAEEERGTKVSVEGGDLAEEFINALECVIFDGSIMKIKARFSYHEIDLRKIVKEDFEQIAVSLERHNFDDRFEVKFI